jgi:hypothetical protein
MRSLPVPSPPSHPAFAVAPAMASLPASDPASRSLVPLAPRRATLVLLALLLTVTAHAPAPGHAAEGRAEDDRRAAAARLVARSAEVRFVAVQVLESHPVQFALVVEVEMPEPRWTLEVDSVAAPDATGRILVRATGTRHGEVLPQVVTPVSVRIPLGSLPAGDYLVDLFVAKGPQAYRRVGTVMLEAS